MTPKDTPEATENAPELVILDDDPDASTSALDDAASELRAGGIEVDKVERWLQASQTFTIHRISCAFRCRTSSHQQPTEAQRSEAYHQANHGDTSFHTCPR